jgi:FAD:protein FMN transferase
MGTWVAIEASADLTATEQAAIDAAYASISVIERLMHPHRNGSDLARINTAPVHTPIEVQPDTRRLLQLARRLYDLTGGVFDPCLPDQPGRLEDVELDDRLVLVCRAPVAIDLGGIAKGYAIDRAIEKLTECGCSAGLVNAGGDLRIFGERAQTLLLRETAGTRNDTGRTRFRPVELQNAALAVSDLDATEHPVEHQGYYNRCDRPVVRRYAAVIAQTAAVADALTKCVLLCSDDQASRVLRELEAHSV